MYQVCTVAGFLFLARRGRHAAFRRTQLCFMLVLPFLLQWSLGGFAASSAVGLWAVTAPFGALTFQGARASVPWFLGFLGLLSVSAAIDSSLTPADIPSWLVRLFFFLNVGAVSFTAFLLLQYFVRGLAAERERSERLLLNVLPAPIAERLKRESGIIADRCPEVSVLFAELAGFTPTAERLPPEEVVSLLDGIFSEFDRLVARYGLEKIKTMGDGYMAAGGIPVFVQDSRRADRRPRARNAACGRCALVRFHPRSAHRDRHGTGPARQSLARASGARAKARSRTASQPRSIVLAPPPL